MAPTSSNQYRTNCNELYRRVAITSKARYHSARRLKIHSWFSQWTLSVLAVGQIVITIVKPLALSCNIGENYITFSSIFFGVLVLAYSLLLGMGNYSERSVKLHHCGLELGRLARRLYKPEGDSEVLDYLYKKESESYYNILDKCENHTKSDYWVAHYEFYSPLGFSKDVMIRYKIYFYHAVQFSHYVVSATLIWSWIAFIIWPSPCTYFIRSI